MRLKSITQNLLVFISLRTVLFGQKYSNITFKHSFSSRRFFQVTGNNFSNTMLPVYQKATLGSKMCTRNQKIYLVPIHQLF